MPHDLTLLHDVALGIIFAALLAHLARRIRQPLLLGYIAGGMLLGPNLGLGLVSSEASVRRHTASAQSGRNGAPRQRSTSWR